MSTDSFPVKPSIDDNRARLGLALREAALLAGDRSQSFTAGGALYGYSAKEVMLIHAESASLNTLAAMLNKEANDLLTFPFLVPTPS